MTDVSSVANKLRRSIHSGEEVHSRVRPPDRHCRFQIFPSANSFIHSSGLRLSDRGSLSCSLERDSGPRQREGITVRTHLRDDLQQRPG